MATEIITYTSASKIQGQGADNEPINRGGRPSFLEKLAPTPAEAGDILADLYYFQGSSGKQMARILHCNRITVYNSLRKLGYPIKPQGHPKRACET